MISPTMAKIISYLPRGFVISISRKILDGYLKKYANIKVRGLENLKDVKKPILFVCNHLSNSDALVINKVLKDYDITFVAGIKLSKNPLTNLGINITKTITIKPNTADKEAISSIVKALKNGNNVLIFPEGTRSRTGSMIEGKKGVVLIQKLSKATVIPMSITGTEKLLPINSKDMGSEKFQYSDVNINLGKSLDIPKREDGEEKHHYEERVLECFMKNIAILLPEEYQGVYKIENEE
ncbi:1-acyl-sn-glycerol-3-phosphate acyltransferase [Clostridium tetanomorphum]|uniref:1-acyl-sn-glycerol-3-phosphate acyltransferase n=1 Tax=Clostridium tetanomorphum TaxID=1553 RepID=A0A923J237_CLOTT|nr:lysophospholipid acyltransferase family protein [Clostridium tetanomorphum]KAJ50421.1 1-acyl-sn-glycerol-3-phosphate acyltransferase [Clostridium tetanomorphum DSM 665]MBC2399429.1 1-acyl-sn-glycerol-3-phosphate acyltransferase [Clostridium tetanomorphum]MBP1865764.1 1-acyl-sn-glycerol-3-phosphate acyltransferase [Clostridium tetanomorphum]NRS86886.1 1-acyl-sn-glycerol-3-phosphate acyltransferase [Clostridium tetanomorphum]NRZ99358.1 1-acyl-sn-glycerol-3-phosphate acyltransferase [Clostridi